MTETLLSSSTREVVIGFEQPFCIIGERINPSGRQRLAAQMAAGDYRQVEAEALAQVAAGAHMLDVNAGIPLADEPHILAETVQLVQSLVDVPLSIDSSIVAALEAGLAVYRGKPLVNSVTGEDERLESVLPLVKRYGAAVVAISNDETGISEDPDVAGVVRKTMMPFAVSSIAQIAALASLAAADELQVRVDEAARERLGLPVFVKPARAGSSIGITRVTDWAQFPAAVAEAAMSAARRNPRRWVTGMRRPRTGMGRGRPELAMPSLGPGAPGGGGAAGSAGGHSRAKPGVGRPRRSGACRGHLIGSDE